MEEEAMASDSTLRRPKRARVPTKSVNFVTGDNDGLSDQSPSNDDSLDDFDEPPPKPKRNRTTEGSSAAPNLSDQSLIEVIKGNGKSIPHVVKFWVEQYEKNPKPAMIELLKMLFEACGAKYQFKGDFLEETDVDDVVVSLVKLAEIGEVEDYQSSKKKEFKNFKENLVSFWRNLVSECQNGPLFDQVLFDKCMDYIIALSCTPPRVYRQVASIMGLQLVTSFIDMAKILGTQRETTQRQLNAEKKKRSEGPRVESLHKRLSVTHEKITMIEEMMRKIFTGLFVHRYRDIDPEIRMSCIEALGVWIFSYPSLFLQDFYLKYLGWTLNDKSAGVRKASVLGLQNLYEADDNVPSLGLFTERFYKRMLELADDIDISVAVCAIGLVKQLLRHQLVPDEELGSLYDLLIDDPPEIRRAIGALVYDHLIAQKFNSSQPSSGDDNDSTKIHLGRMLQILREFSADQILSIYVIDDVWEYMSAMKDWKCIVSMLLDENPSIEFTDDDATNLIRLLCASVKKAVGERIVPATDNRKPHQSKALKEMIENSKSNITTSMMKNYPQLLRKFMLDKAKVPALVEIIVNMNLEIYSLKRQEQNFKTVLQLIKEAFFKHVEKDALRSCVKAINFCSTESKGELRDFAESKMKEVENELIAKITSAIKEVADGDDEYLLLVNLKRLYELHLTRPVPIEGLYEDLVVLLQQFRSLDEEIVSFVLLNMHLHVAWCLHSIMNSKTVSESSLSSLISKREALFDQLDHFMQTLPGSQEEGRSGNLLASRVCAIATDAWCLFKKSTFASTKLESLGYCPTQTVLQKYWKLVEKKLHVSDEMEDEDVNREYIEETNRDAVIIAAAKLVATDTVPKDYLSSQIISHYVMHGSSVAEIVKNLITVLKRKYNIFSIFLEALKRAYERHLAAVLSSSEESESETSKTFQDCKDLAAKLSGTFIGAARNKYRPDILKIVEGGIEYAFLDAPKQLSFLEASVLHFVSKLPTPDIADIVRKVQRRTESMNINEDPNGWRPYSSFLDTLKEKCSKNEIYQVVEEKEGTSVKRRGRPRKKRNVEGKKLFDDNQNSSEDEEDDGEEEDAISEHEDDNISLKKLRALGSQKK